MSDRGEDNAIAGEDRVAIENAREEAVEAAFPSETHAEEFRAKPAGTTEPPRKRLRALAEEQDGMERVLEDDGEDVFDDDANPAATETTGIAGPTPLADRDVKEEDADAAARVAAAARAAVEASAAAAAAAGGGARGGEGGAGGEDKDNGTTNNGGNTSSAVADEEAEEAKREAAVIDALADAEDDFERRRKGGGGGAEPATVERSGGPSSSSSQPNHSHSQSGIVIDEATREKVRAKLEAALEKADNAATAEAKEKEKEKEGGSGGEDKKEEDDDSEARRLRRSEIAASVEAEAARGSTSRSVYFSKVGNAARLAASSALPLPPTSGKG